MPSARTTIFGSALKSRFGVNGIQYSSSDSGVAVAAPWIFNSAWPIVSSWRCDVAVQYPGGASVADGTGLKSAVNRTPSPPGPAAAGRSVVAEAGAALEEVQRDHEADRGREEVQRAEEP